jgi:hypothetical protein
MNHLLRWVARIAGAIGVVLCAVSMLSRMGGVWMVGGFQVGTLLQAGIAGMVLGCLAYLAILVEKTAGA